MTISRRVLDLLSSRGVDIGPVMRSILQALDEWQDSTDRRLKRIEDRLFWEPPR